jgi:hypothetical protein
MMLKKKMDGTKALKFYDLVTFMEYYDPGVIHTLLFTVSSDISLYVCFRLRIEEYTDRERIIVNFPRKTHKNKNVYIV